MKNLIIFLRNKYAEVYKISLFVISIALITMLYPREGKFRFEYQKGKPWLHDDLIASFDFGVKKTSSELEAEKELTLKKIKPYFKKDLEIQQRRKKSFVQDFEKSWAERFENSNALLQKRKNQHLEIALNILDSVYNKGIIQQTEEIEGKEPDFSIIVLIGKVAEEIELSQLFTLQAADNFIRNELKKYQQIESDWLLRIIENQLSHNILFDAKTTENARNTALQNISDERGMIQNGERIISKGELITSEKFQVIESYKAEYENRLGVSSKYFNILIGQILLITISMCVLILFLVSFRKDIYAENKKILFILILIFLMVLSTSLVVRYNSAYLYLVPMCIVPIVIRIFSDTRLALFVHIVTIIIIGFLVPNSFELVFLQFIAGIVSIISIVNVRRRSQLFLTAGLIFATYSLTYLGMLLAQEGEVEKISLTNFIYFGGNSILTLLTYPLIFIFERIFGFVTDVTLMELSDTNNPLLRDLATKAPGTFQHSLQVANLAEAAIFQIGGNTLLARTGALYHDIGKMDMALYFIENKRGDINPHDELSYEESARIIISHTIKGIEKAKKYGIPEQIIDFIRTHHGTTKTKYFYHLHLQNNPYDEVDADSFTYRGPIPYSKETAVVMMADAVEAASRTLKSYDELTINTLVENVIAGQIENKQFANSNITFKDITEIKKVFKKKLINIYHARIEYPNF